MEVVVERLSVVVNLVSPLILVLGKIRAPMESGSELVVATCTVFRAVTSALNNVDFSRHRPGSVLVVPRKHPDCGP